MRLLQIAGVIVTGLAMTIASARANILVSDTTGTSSRSGTFAGQSVTTPTWAPFFDDISFNFYNTAGAAAAAGTLYVFSSPYTGTPSGLASLSPSAYLASAAASDGVYTFAPSFELQGGTVYYFYESGALSVTGGSNSYAGGSAYYATSSGGSYTTVTSSDTNFTLTGSAVPEPATLALFGSGVLALNVIRRRGSAQRQNLRLGF